MKGSLQIVLSTIVLFVAGLMVGAWTQRSNALPPPPIGPMGEFGHFHRKGFGAPGRLAQTPTPDQIRERMSSLAPEIDAFQAKIDAIEQRFRSGLHDVLKPGQQEKLDIMAKHLGELPNPMPGCTSEIGPVFVSMVIYRPLFEHLSQGLALDNTQRQRLKELLADRRTQLLALVDDTPPPSFRLPELIGSGPQPPDED